MIAKRHGPGSRSCRCRAAASTASDPTVCDWLVQALSSARSHSTLITLGNAARQFGGRPRGRRLKERLSCEVSGGDLQPPLNIAAHFVGAERVETVPTCHPLQQRALLGPTEQRVQFRLPDEHDVQQPMALHVEVRDHPKLLQHFLSQAVRIVDDRDGSDAERHERGEELFQTIEQLEASGPSHPRVASCDHTELDEEVAQKLLGRRRQLRQDRNENTGVLLFGDDPAQHRFASADLTRDNREPFAAKPYGDVLERGPVSAALEDVARVRCQRERRFPQAEVNLIAAGGIDSRRNHCGPCREGGGVIVARQDPGGARICEQPG